MRLSRKKILLELSWGEFNRFMYNMALMESLIEHGIQEWEHWDSAQDNMSVSERAAHKHYREKVKYETIAEVETARD